MYSNKDLELDIDNIKFMQESIETDVNKMAVSLEEDESLAFPLLIEVEDNCYSYDNVEERINDYELLVKELTDNSTRYFYF